MLTSQYCENSILSPNTKYSSYFMPHHPYNSPTALHPSNPMPSLGLSNYPLKWTRTLF